MNTPNMHATLEAAPTSTSGDAFHGPSATFQDPAFSQTVHQCPATWHAPFDARISRTESADSNELRVTTFREAMEQIRCGVYAKPIAAVRTKYQEGGKEAARPLKVKLPCVTFSGHFEVLKGGLPSPHSGLIVADIDELGAGLEQARRTLTADPHVIALFLSPTGSGLKAIFRCNPHQDHKETFISLRTHCQSIHGLQIDPAGRNVNRLCFLSHDPDAVVRDVAQELPTENSTAGQAKTSPVYQLQPPDPDVTREVAEADLNRIPASCGRDTWIRVGMGLKHQFADAGYELWDSWSATCGEKYPGPTKTQTEWDSFNNNPPGKTPVTYGTVRHLAKPVEIILPGPGNTITDCARTLFREIALQKQIFLRGGALQELMPRDGSTSLRVITPEAFQSRIETYGRVVKCDSKTGKLVSAICSRPTAASLMQSEEAERLLPAIELLSGCPIFAKTPDGAKVLHEGWHPQKVYVTAGGTPPRVTIQEAIASLENILGDFDFATPSDRTRALAALISPAMSSGGWIDKHPFMIVMADASQTGKGYLLECIAAIYREIPSIITPRRGGVGGADESIDQALIDGRPFIQLDNWRGDLASPRLEALITAPGLVNARVPHRSEVSVNPRRFVFQLTSNGLKVTPDLANRASIIRLRKRPRGYVFRNYSEGDLVSHLKAKQPYYLGCVFAILQEWVEYGAPSNGETGHDFRGWAGKAGWITDNLFMQPALLGDADAAARNLTDPEEGWLKGLLQRIVVLRRDGKLSGPFSATALAEVAVEFDLLPPGLNGDDTDKCRQRIGTILKDLFDRSEQIEVDGRKLTRSVVRGDKGEERKVYQLSD